MAKLSTTSTDRDELSSILGNRSFGKIGNNTYLARRGPLAGAIAVQLHHTDVVTVEADGSVTFTTGGYESVTTKDRINAFARDLNCRVHARDFTWYFTDVDGETVPFGGGITVDRNGRMAGKELRIAA